MYIYIRQYAPMDDEELYVFYPVLIDREDENFYYGHYENNGLKWKFAKEDVYELNGKKYANRSVF